MKIDGVIKNPLQLPKVEIEKENQAGFSDVLKNALNQVNDLQVQSRELDELLAMGKAESLHEVTVAAEKASIALQFTIEIKNKIIDAYKEITRMQI